MCQNVKVLCLFENTGFGIRHPWVQIQAFPLAGCVAMVTFLLSSSFQFMVKWEYVGIRESYVVANTQ